MLIEFRVNNFKSIKDTAKISMVSGKGKDLQKNVFTALNYKLLRSAIIYGANGSGKSNVFKAMAFMKHFVLKSVAMLETDKIPVESFRLHTETDGFSSSFQIVFLIDKVKYRYGFELDDEKVYSEWLYSNSKGKEARLFFREEGKYYINSNYFKEGRALAEKTRDNALFLTVVAQFNGKISRQIVKWFVDFNQIHGLKDDLYITFTMQKLKQLEFKKEIVKMLKFADVGIEDAVVEEKDFDAKKLPALLSESLQNTMPGKEIKEINVLTTHSKYNEKMEFVDKVTFEMNKEESDGTRKFFAVSAPVLDTLKNGKILVIDELDSGLHPLLMEQLVQMFNNPKINKTNAQLIFTTHNTNLLNNKLFRRDQIWFTEKDKYGATELYSLAEYKKTARKESAWEKQYLEGRYGGVPYIVKDFIMTNNIGK